MDTRLTWLYAAMLCAAGALALLAARRVGGPPMAEPIEPAPEPVFAVVRTHFVDGGGYVEIGGVVVWASADPARPLQPGQVVQCEPGDDSHTVTVAGPDTPAEATTAVSVPEEHRA
ncbi:hypothetical protein [Dactylosporangium sp. NPDC051541]|uniref:hypothetical protein n=1 Tax=Dactylosporangium sp. NPDC051541 TaxID=3363977 RepID=UPI003794EC90